MPSQRTNTRLLTSDELAKVQRLLRLPAITSAIVTTSTMTTTTTATTTTTTPPWAGEKDRKIRGELVSKLTKALGDRLEIDYKEAQRRAKLPVITLDVLEDAGTAAQAAVNEVFSAWTARAALTATDQRRRKTHVFTASGATANLLDAADSDARTRGKKPLNALEMAKHFTAVDNGCKSVMAAYEFNPSTGSADETECFFTEVLGPFVQQNEGPLKECDRFGYWQANPDLGLVFALRYVDGWDPSEGYDVPAIRNRKAHAYVKLIHEYIHTLQHPVMPDATGESATIKEGVCEYLTTKVMAQLGEKSDEEFGDIAARVEGSYAEGRGAALRARVRRYQAASEYASAVADVKQAIITMGGDDNGLLAAFFQGHTEYIGRSYGNWLGGVRELPSGERTMPWPLHETLKSIEDLARQSGLGPDVIMKDNPGLNKTDSPAQIVLRGFHGHRLVSERSKTEEAWENWAMIAAQHGVDARTIRALNGDPVTMPLGQWILVPDA